MFTIFVLIIVCLVFIINLEDMKKIIEDKQECKDEKIKNTKEDVLYNLLVQSKKANDIAWEKFGFEKLLTGMYKKPVLVNKISGYFEINLVDYGNDVENIIVYRSKQEGTIKYTHPIKIKHDELWYDKLVDVLESIVEENNYIKKQNNKEKEERKIAFLENEDLFEEWG